jgi:hypothetical protein
MMNSTETYQQDAALAFLIKHHAAAATMKAPKTEQITIAAICPCSNVVVWLAMEGEGGGDVLETAAWPGGLFI